MEATVAQLLQQLQPAPQLHAPPELASMLIDRLSVGGYLQNARAWVRGHAVHVATAATVIVGCS